MNEDFVDLDLSRLEATPSPKNNNSITLPIILMIAGNVILFIALGYMVFFNPSGKDDDNDDIIIPTQVTDMAEAAIIDYLTKKEDITRLIAKEVLEGKITTTPQLATVVRSYQDQAYKTSNTKLDILDKETILEDFAKDKQRIHDYFMAKADGIKRVKDKAK